MPCLTFCPWKVFKNRGFFYRLGDFINQTFDCKDIFLNENFCNLNSQTKVHVEEIKSIFLGRCYMVCHLEPQQKKKPVYILIKKNQDVTGTASLNIIEAS